MPLRRVDIRQAGSEAVGILVPPGQRTFVVVRPRGLSWDLLPVRWAGDPAAAPMPCTFTRDEAAAVARNLGKFLEHCDAHGISPVETLGRSPEFQVWLRVDDLFWLMFAREARQTYRPLFHPSLDAAQAAARLVVDLILPGPSRTREYYFNTQNIESNCS